MKIEIKSVEYASIHQWIRYHHGRASYCSNKNCQSKNPKRFEWALKKGKSYERNVNNYIQMCASCHRKYDFSEKQRKNMSDAHVGVRAVWNWKSIIGTHIKSGKVVYFKSLTEAAKKMGVDKTAICAALNGRAKSSCGYKWKHVDNIKIITNLNNLKNNETK